MFSHIPPHLTDTAVVDWGGYREPKWLWRVTNSRGTLSLGVNIMSYHDLPVDTRNASIFGSWLLRRCLAGIYPGPGRAVPHVIAFCLVWCDAGLLSWGSQSPPAAPGSVLGPECSLLCLRHCRCSPKFAAPGAGNQTDCITESPCALSSGFPTSVGVIRL